MVTQCCECRKACEDNRWDAPIVLSDAGERVSHGYCPSCYEKANQEAQAYFNRDSSMTTG
jgi:hypothetical protein